MLFDKIKFDEMKKFENFQYIFRYNFDREHFDAYCKNYEVIKESVASFESHLTSEGDVICTRINHDLIENVFDLEREYKEFLTTRPESILPNIKEPSISEMCDYFEDLFAGAIFQRAIDNNPECNPDAAWPQIDRALKWIRSTDFYKAPASSRFHDSHEGGLCMHSIRVAARAVELMRSSKFNHPEKIGEVVFCALVHDWCKIGLYESFMKNVKNDNTGVWEKVQAYRYKGQAMMNLGHGVSSMFLASKFFRLSIEEASAIRWHMGAYRTSETEFNELQTSNENFILVHLLQFADQLSLVNY